MDQLTGAPITMHKQGLSTDFVVLEAIERKPGATIAEIARDLQWTNGKVDGSIMRLNAKDKVAIKHFIKKGMLIKKIYPKGYAIKVTGQIEIPRELLTIDSWKQQAFVYALSRSTIGIAPQKIQEWDIKAFFKQSLHLEKTNQGLILQFPQRLADFYQLENSEISLSSVGDQVFVTVESILPIATQNE